MRATPRNRLCASVYDPSRRERILLERANQLALQSPARNYMFGAIVVKSGRIVSTGTNNPQKTHPRAGYPRRIHAEIQVLLGTDDLKGATMYLVRVTNGGKEALSKPCQNCLREIKKSGLKSVIFSLGKGEYGKIDLRDVAPN